MKSRIDETHKKVDEVDERFVGVDLFEATIKPMRDDLKEVKQD